MRALTLRGVLWVFAAAVLLSTGCKIPPGPPVVKPRPDGGLSTVDRITYHGWKNSLRIRNRTAEVVVVPDIGRVMSFRLTGGRNVFWEDCSLDGQRGDWEAKEWVNFGGDKTWPSPEAEWSDYTGRKEWRPPPAFDSLPVQATIEGSDLILTSPIDPFYQMRTIRRVHLYSNILQIATSYERVAGAPSKIGVWVITQFKNPVAVYVPTKTNSIFPQGHFVFGNQPWPQLQVTNQHIRITRDPKAPHKMGCDAEQLLWMGEKEMCLVSSERDSAAEYPDRGSSAEVYTNPDPREYVELEFLGPLTVMEPSDRISAKVTYTLMKRSQVDPAAELVRLGW